jgi:hypothetical protein
VAQKLHACTEDLGEERPNQRARDLADILLIEELALGDEQMSGLRDACVEIFELRGKHPWPPTVVAWPGWDDIWERLVETERLDYSITEAIAGVQDLVDRIDSALPEGATGLASGVTRPAPRADYPQAR